MSTPVYKSSSKSEIASAYDVTIQTLNKWIIPIESELGEYVSRHYTPKQVSMIVDYCGVPRYPNLICV